MQKNTSNDNYITIIQAEKAVRTLRKQPILKYTNTEQIIQDLSTATTVEEAESIIRKLPQEYIERFPVDVFTDRRIFNNMTIVSRGWIAVMQPYIATN